MKETFHYVGQQMIWMAYVTRELILAMGLGVKWVFMTIRMLIFAALIGPFFVPNIVWYIVSPTVIRRVSYRTSKTTRARFLKKLLRKARREVKEGERVQQQQQHPSRAISCEKGGVANSRWSKLAATVPSFLTPSASRRSLSAVSDESDASHAPLVPDGEAVSRSPEPSNPGDQQDDDFACMPLDPLEARSGPHYANSVHTSSEDDDDEDGEPEDVEDRCNLHNRATLDIFLPCPLDELLQVQQRSMRTGVYAPSPAPAEKARRKRPDSSHRAPSAVGGSETEPRASGRSTDDHLEPKTYPIVISVSGGAWIIGSHLWSAMLARLLASQGYLVFCPDYRNFPQANMAEMTRDVSDAIGWVLQHARRYNGDLSRVTLIGQSAGAHLAWMSIISQARLVAAAEEAASPVASQVASPHRPTTPHRGEELPSFSGPSLATTLNSATQQWLDENTATAAYARRVGADALEAPLPSETLQQALERPSQQVPTRGNEVPHRSVYDVPRYHPRNSIHHFVCLGGIYDLAHLLRHFHGRGLYRKVLYRIAGSKERLRNEFCINRYFEFSPAAAETLAPTAAGNRCGLEAPGFDVPARPTELCTRSEETDSTVVSSAAERPVVPSQQKLDDHSSLLSSTMPEFFRKACRDSQGQDSLWAVERVLLNDSFLEPESLAETFPRNMKALDGHAVGGGVAGSSTASLPQGTLFPFSTTHHPRERQCDEEGPGTNNRSKEAAEASKLAFVRYLPPLISFLHGDADASAPFSEPVKLYRRILEAQKYLATSDPGTAEAGMRSELRLVCIAKGTHTNMIVEELLTGKSCVVRWLSKDDHRRRQRRPVATKSASVANERREKLDAQLKSTNSGSSAAGGGNISSPAAAQDDLHAYAVISLETPPSAQRLLIRVASFVCPF